MKFIKTNLKQQQQQHDSSTLPNETNPSQLTTSQSLSSQLRLSNNVVQDTIKVIKLSSFLFKIFSTFLRLHSTELFGQCLDSIRHPLLSILAQINSICLDEMPHGDDKSSLARFNSIKQDFLKEYAPNYENLLQLILNEPNMISSLADLSESFNDDTSPFETALFYLICLNRVNDVDFESSIQTLISYLTQSQDAIYSPVFCSYSKKFFQDTQLDFNRMIDVDNSSCVEFYDLVVVLTGKFVLQSGLNQSKVYYLLSSLASNDPLRSQLSYDILFFLIRNYAVTCNNANFLHLVKFVCLVYESTGLVTLKHMLSDILSESLPDSLAIDLENFFTQNKLYRCLSLHSKSTPNLMSTLLCNSVGYTIDFIDSLEKILSTSGNDTLTLRKSFQFIQTNKMPQLVELTTGILRRYVDGQIKMNTNGVIERLCSRLVSFVKIDKIDALLANPDSQKPFFQLLLRLLNILSVSLAASTASDHDEIVSFLFDFYIKNCTKRYLIKKKGKMTKKGRNPFKIKIKIHL